MNQLKTILVDVDFSDGSRRALEPGVHREQSIGQSTDWAEQAGTPGGVKVGSGETHRQILTITSELPISRDANRCYSGSSKRNYD